MALNPNELAQGYLSNVPGVGSGKRVFPSSVQPKTFKSGTGTIAKCTPVTYEDASAKWIVWQGGTTEVSTLKAASTTATDGTFTLTVNGKTTAAIDHDAAAAAIKTAIVNAGIGATGDLTVVDAGGGLAANNGTATITWAGDLKEQALNVTADFSGLVGNPHTLTETTAGASLRIDGFVWPDNVTLDSDEEVLGQVMLGGRIHVGDIVTPATESVGSLKSALRNRQVRDSGFIIEGLEGFH